MKDFQIGEIVALLSRTSAFLAFRFLIYLGITLVYVIGTGVGAGTGYVVGSIGDNAAGFSAWGGLIGFGIVGAVVYMLREYLLYLVKAGHIAVLVELMQGREVPGGRSQIAHAQAIVRERFAEASALFAVDQLIKGVVNAFNRVFFTVASLLPIPGSGGLVKFLNSVLRLSLTYLDEVILGYNIRTQSDNPWASSRTALILYAQNYKVFLKNAFWLAFFVWGLTFLVFLLALAPAAGLVAVFPGSAGPVTLAVAVVFAWAIKQAVIEPFGMVALMQVFEKVTAGQTPDAEWEAKLESLSSKFGELTSRAGGSTSSPASQTTQAGAENPS